MCVLKLNLHRAQNEALQPDTKGRAVGRFQPWMCGGAPIARRVGREIRSGVFVTAWPDRLKHPQDVYTVLHCNLTHTHTYTKQKERRSLFSKLQWIYTHQSNVTFKSTTEFTSYILRFTQLTLKRKLRGLK